MAQEHFPRINTLWNSRDTLSTQEWSEFYRRVIAVLSEYRPREAQSLGETLEDLRHQFFVERVMPGTSRNGPDHTGALKLYFRRYLLDLLRATQDTVDTIPDAYIPHCDLGDEDHQRKVLAEHGLPVEKVYSAAHVFINGLSEDMQLLLRVCGCGDTPASNLAGRIASIHYRSGQLGLVHRRKDDKLSGARQATSSAHNTSLLGSWINKTLGLAPKAAPSGENVEAAQILLDILCVVALTEQTHLDSSQWTACAL